MQLLGGIFLLGSGLREFRLDIFMAIGFVGDWSGTRWWYRNRWEMGQSYLEPGATFIEQFSQPTAASLKML
jgi:hypothetical protein